MNNKCQRRKWRKLLFRERRMWRVLRIIILPIYKNGELCDGEFCEFCETYVSYVLMSKKTATGESMNLCLKNSGRREHELMSKNSGRRGRKWTYVLMSKKRWRELRKICVTLRSLLLAIVTHQVYKKMRLW